MAQSDHLLMYRNNEIRRLQEKQRANAERLSALRTQIAEIESEDTTLQQATLRTIRPIPENCCPRCWIWDGEIAELKPIPSDTDDDNMRCKRCGEDYSLPAA